MNQLQLAGVAKSGEDQEHCRLSVFVAVAHPSFFGSSVKFCCTGKRFGAIPGRWFWFTEAIKLVEHGVFSETDFGEFEQCFFGRTGQVIRG